MFNWQTRGLGLATVVLGFALIYFAAVMIPPDAIDSTVRGAIMVAALGMVTGGAGVALARANAASVAAHQESLDKIHEAKTTQHVAHAENVAKIEQLTAQVEQVPVVVTKTVESSVPQAVAEVIREGRHR